MALQDAFKELVGKVRDDNRFLESSMAAYPGAPLKLSFKNGVPPYFEDDIAKFESDNNVVVERISAKFSRKDHCIVWEPGIIADTNSKLAEWSVEDSEIVTCHKEVTFLEFDTSLNIDIEEVHFSMSRCVGTLSVEAIACIVDSSLSFLWY